MCHFWLDFSKGYILTRRMPPSKISSHWVSSKPLKELTLSKRVLSKEAGLFPAGRGDQDKSLSLRSLFGKDLFHFQNSVEHAASVRDIKDSVHATCVSEDTCCCA